MNYYIRCTKCKYQESGDSTKISISGCPRCESSKVDVHVGNSLPWWDYEAPEEEPKKIRVSFSLVSPFLFGGVLAAAYEGSPWWLLLAAGIVVSWFINPRWSKAKGWRFLHDRE